MYQASLVPTYKRKLVFRVIIFIACLIAYFTSTNLEKNILNFGVKELNFLHVIWVVLFLDMILIFFRKSKVSMGSIKALKRNYIEPIIKPAKEQIEKTKRALDRGALKVAIVWCLLNGIFATLYFTKIIRIKDLFLISISYYVCDLICVLYFCPFQKFFMHNRCCTVCRIFNWDQLMTVTPLLFIPSLFSWTLGIVAIATFIRWEVTYHRRTERFLEITNDKLKCINCTDKMCLQKKPLIIKK